MKILINKYPKGTVKGQKTDGKYIDGYLHENLKSLAKVIVNDMTFLAVCYSSTLEVGTGKSVFMTQMGEAWSEIMKQMHGIDVPFTTKNIVWRPKELIERAFQVPRYSFLLLDEWEDATYWSELGMTLRQFFRKCRQLNLFIAVIIPNWFQLPLAYAVSRSVFAVDVRFEDGFQRGFFSFYNFEAKRKLYIKGKKEHNYHVANPNFVGRFVDGYGVDRAEYLAAKRHDLEKYEKEEPVQLDAVQIKHEIIRELYKNLEGEITQQQIAKGVKLSSAQISMIISGKRGKKPGVVSLTLPNNSYNNPLIVKETEWEEEEQPLDEPKE